MIAEGHIEKNRLTFNLGYAKRSSVVILVALVSAYLLFTVSAALFLTPFGSVWLLVVATCIVLTLHGVLCWISKRRDQIIVRLAKSLQSDGPARFSLEYNHDVLCEGDLTEDRLEIRRVVGRTGKYQLVPCIFNQVHLVLDELPEQLESRSKEGLVLFEREQAEDAVMDVEKIYKFLGLTD